MPITKSAKKAANRSLVFQKRNNEFKLRMKMAIKKFLKSISKAEKV
jgi:ribosomal protein S20